jgi:hypothetical protein
VIVLVVFAIQTLKDAPQTFVAMIGIVALAIVLDLAWSWLRTRRARLTEAQRPEETTPADAKGRP